MLPIAIGALILSQPAPETHRPKLVLVISIDQFRGDYPVRFIEHFLPAQRGGKIGGFRYLTERGAYYDDAHYNHIPTETGVGHATIMTGSVPGLTGIIGNDWYDRKTGKTVYCVQDSDASTVGGNSKPMSPKNLLVTTVGDELKMATNGRAKVVSISFKDRASILLAGHAADQVIWFDGGTSNWVTSTFYNSRLPAWVTDLNAKKRPASELNQVWNPLLPVAEYDLARKPPFQQDSPEPVFSHLLKTIGDWTTSPFGQKFVFDTVKMAIEREGLGSDEVPDVLTVNLATNDYIGHAYGPNSPEVLDITVHTDRLLSDLFNYIDRSIGLKNTTIALTADHGVIPIIEEMANDYKINAARIKTSDLNGAVEVALDAKYGAGDWVQAVDIPNIFLNQATVTAKKLDPEEVEKSAGRAIQGLPGIFAVVTRTQIASGNLPKTPWAQRVANGFNPQMSGDVFVINSPGTYFGTGRGTGHGSVWEYDGYVPIILAGFGIQPGVRHEQVFVNDIAPTLSRLLKIVAPSGNVGRVLPGALR